MKNPIRVPPAERPCPRCGTERKTVDFETTEVVDLIPAEVIVRVDEREVCACPKCDGAMERAPQGDKVIVGGTYGSQLVASLVVGKYADGLPLHRQREMLKRLHFDMPSSSMADQITWATDLLQPIWRGLIEVARAALLLHVDALTMERVVDRRRVGEQRALQAQLVPGAHDRQTVIADRAGDDDGVALLQAAVEKSPEAVPRPRDGML